VGIHIRTSYRWCWWLRNAALSYEMQRQLEGTVEADELYHTAGQKGQAKQGGKKRSGRRPRCRRKKREPGRGHDDKDRPAMIAWVSRQGAVVVQAVRNFTVSRVQKAADLAVQTGSRLYTDSANSYRALKGYRHACVNHTQKEYARGDVHENRAECLCSLLTPYLRVFRGISKLNVPGYLGFFQFLRNYRQGRVSRVEMAAPMVLIYKELFPSISTFETPPRGTGTDEEQGLEGPISTCEHVVAWRGAKPLTHGLPLSSNGCSAAPTGRSSRG
jgi:transposase-like protein